MSEDRAPQALRHNILAALEQEAAQIQQEEQEAARAESRRRRKIWAAPLAASMAILLFLPAFTSRTPDQETRYVSYARSGNPLHLVRTTSRDRSIFINVFIALGQVKIAT